MYFTKCIEQREYQRIPANLEVYFYCGDKICCGTITDISEKGMFINTKIEFPFDLTFELNIPISENIFRVPVKIRRIAITDGYYGGLGVDLLKPSQNYSEFVKKLKASLAESIK